jgi:hypothetical protein
MNPSPTPDAPQPVEMAHIKKIAIAVALGLLAILLVWGGATVAAEMTQKQIQKEYLAATDESARASFAKRHGRHPLGGLVLLGQAHSYYNSGNYAAALGAYTSAQAGLKTQPILAEQALLGEAFAQYYLDSAKGLEHLRQIAMDNTLLESTRALCRCRATLRSCAQRRMGAGTPVQKAYRYFWFGSPMAAPDL